MIVANHKPGTNIGESLVQMQIISAEQLQSALQVQQERGEKLSEILISQGIVRAEELASFLSIEWNIPLIDLKTHVIQPEALQLVPERMARQHTLIPLNIMGESLVVVMADPDDYNAIGDLFTLTGMKIEVAFANAADIRRAIDIYYRSNEEIQERVTQYVPAGQAEARAVPGLRRRYPHHQKPRPHHRAGRPGPGLGYPPGAPGGQAARTLPHRRDITRCQLPAP